MQRKVNVSVTLSVPSLRLNVNPAAVHVSFGMLILAFAITTIVTGSRSWVYDSKTVQPLGGQSQMCKIGCTDNSQECIDQYNLVIAVHDLENSMKYMAIGAFLVAFALRKSGRFSWLRCLTALLIGIFAVVLPTIETTSWNYVATNQNWDADGWCNCCVPTPTPTCVCFALDTVRHSIAAMGALLLILAVAYCITGYLDGKAEEKAAGGDDGAAASDAANQPLLYTGSQYQPPPSAAAAPGPYGSTSPQ